MGSILILMLILANLPGECGLPFAHLVRVRVGARVRVGVRVRVKVSRSADLVGDGLPHAAPHAELVRGRLRGRIRVYVRIRLG